MEILKKILLLFSIILLIIVIVLLVLYFFSINKNSNYIQVFYKPNIQIDIYGEHIDKNASEFELSNLPIDDSIIVKLSQFPQLKKVIFKNQVLSVDLQHELEKRYPNINFEWDINIANQLVNCNVNTLDLSNCTVENINTFKSSLELLHNLKYLDMSDCNLSNEDLAKLREEFPNIKVVWKIYFSVWSLKTDAVAFSVLISNFKYTYLTSKTIEVFKYCTDLQALDLGHQKITDISVIGDYLPNLRVLILADNQIKDITPLKKLKHLHYLELFINNITDISPLTECAELVDINLAYTPVRDFSPLLNGNFPVLERVWLKGCNISTKNFNALVAKYPNAKISKSGNGSTGDGWRTHDRYFAMIDMFNKRDYISELFTRYDT